VGATVAVGSNVFVAVGFTGGGLFNVFPELPLLLLPELPLLLLPELPPELLLGLPEFPPVFLGAPNKSNAWHADKANARIRTMARDFLSINDLSTSISGFIIRILGVIAPYGLFTDLLR